ncbi:MAG: MFS transporter [Candidatus Thermoplasmatota archaeon]|nr:MFS transporter [Candidatus Thermoplasmatota archaeon]MCL5955687.1 MFS transporter [Candidatus Thermoplasmatota archaeon]
MADDNNGAKVEERFKFLLVSRALRSAALIFVTLSTPLYLLKLNFDIISIGLVYLFVSITTVLISLSIGMLGDRIGFKKALIIGEIPAIFITAALTFSTSIYVILAGIIISGTTGSAGAMRGAMSPGMNAYIATNWPDSSGRVRKMALITSVASIFSIIGSLILYSYAFLTPFYGSVNSFRILYGISLVLVLASFTSLFMIREKPVIKKKERVMKKASGKYVLKVSIANGINGSGIGLAIVLLPAWYELRFGLTESQVALAFLGSYAATAIGGFLASRISISANGRSTLKVAWVTRVIQGSLLVLMAISPYVIIAILLYSGRSLLAGFGMPSRNAVNVSGLQEGDFGAGTSLQGVSVRISQGFSGLSGYLMDIDLPFPVVLGGILQAVSGVVYYKLMKNNE